jgi:hypothetical protein
MDISKHRTRKRITAMVVGLASILATGSSAASEPSRFFGYFASSTYIAENYQHTNVTHIWAGFGDRSHATTVILQELDAARAYGVKAIVEVPAFVFSSNKGRCPYSLQSASASHWNDFIDTLIAHGHINPGNADASTVLGFYPVDEPELCGLTDQGGSAHPALVNAINTIRNHPVTATYPIGTIASKKYANAIRGLRLFDWVGLDNYSVSTSSYLSQFTTFESKLLPHQRSILVPQASRGGFMSSYGAYHDPEMILDRFLSNPRIIGIVPFLWGHAETTGVRGIPELETAYTAIGNHIASGAPLPLKVSSHCFGSGGLFECSASASHGTPPYTYDWQGAYRSGSGYAVYNLICGVVHQVQLVVTDSGGQQQSVTHQLYCARGSIPY